MSNRKMTLKLNQGVLNGSYLFLMLLSTIGPEQLKNVLIKIKKYP